MMKCEEIAGLAFCCLELMEHL